MLIRLFIFSVVLQSLLLATDGDLDTSFGSGGKVITDVSGSDDDLAESVAIQNDGKIIAAGRSDNGSNNDFALVRYNPNGSLDTSFSGDGKVTTPVGGYGDSADSVAIQSDDKIVAVGYSYNGSNFNFAVVRYTSNGNLDSTFSGDGKVILDIGGDDDFARSVAIQNDGKIVVAGNSDNGSGNDFAVVRYKTNGSLDATFGNGGKVVTDLGDSYDIAYSVAIQNSGKIVVAGEGNNKFAVVRYNSNGSLDTTFNSDGKVFTNLGGSYESAHSVAIQSDGRIVAAGRSYNGSNYDFALVRYNANGSLDTTFSGDGKVIADLGGHDDLAESVAIQSDGRIVVAGESYNGSNSDFAVVRYTSNGSLDTAFSGDGKVITDLGGLDDSACSVAIQSNGRIVAAGREGPCGNRDFALVRYLATPVTLAPIYYLLQ